MKRHVSFFALPLPIILAALLLLSQQGGPVQTEPDLPTEEVTVSFYADYPTYPSLEQMCDAADIIVTGQYTEYLSSWNMNRDASDPSKEDPNTYSEGRLYAFQVDQVLKGQAPEAITVTNNTAWGPGIMWGRWMGSMSMPLTRCQPLIASSRNMVDPIFCFCPMIPNLTTTLPWENPGRSCCGPMAARN